MDKITKRLNQKMEFKLRVLKAIGYINAYHKIGKGNQYAIGIHRKLKEEIKKWHLNPLL